MPPKLREHFDLELSLAHLAIKANDQQTAWKHLGRAHILGQFFALAHLHVHWVMFLYGIKTITWSEILGQVPRLLLAALGSWTKRAPKGNTGLSNVGIFQPTELPSDLIQILKIN